eukprot:2322345-Rhodomonas_salina.1
MRACLRPRLLPSPLLSPCPSSALLLLLTHRHTHTASLGGAERRTGRRGGAGAGKERRGGEGHGVHDGARLKAHACSPRSPFSPSLSGSPPSSPPPLASRKKQRRAQPELRAERAQAEEGVCTVVFADACLATLPAAAYPAHNAVLHYVLRPHKSLDPNRQRKQTENTFEGAMTDIVSVSEVVLVLLSSASAVSSELKARSTCTI